MHFAQSDLHTGCYLGGVDTSTLSTHHYAQCLQDAVTGTTYTCNLTGLLEGPDRDQKCCEISQLLHQRHVSATTTKLGSEERSDCKPLLCDSQSHNDSYSATPSQSVSVLSKSHTPPLPPCHLIPHPTLHDPPPKPPKLMLYSYSPPLS